MPSKKTQQKSKGQKPARKAIGPVTKQLPIDAHARKWAKLLADPCRAGIVPACYDGPGSGNFVRVESDFIIGNEPTAVGSAILFTPGVLSNGSGTSSVFAPSAVVTTDTGTITWTANTANQPGYGMAPSFAAVRTVAACLQVTYAGTEQQRAGFVSIGQTDLAAAGGYNTLAKLRTAADVVVRMPNESIQYAFEPNNHSSSFMSTTVANTDRESHPCIYVAASGMAGSTGVRVRMVVVYEWLPTAMNGGTNALVPAPSESTYSSVLRWLAKIDPDWQLTLASIGKSLSTMI